MFINLFKMVKSELKFTVLFHNVELKASEFYSVIFYANILFIQLHVPILLPRGILHVDHTVIFVIISTYMCCMQLQAILQTLLWGRGGGQFCQCVD